ncbi:MAG: hypothetical protein LUC85_09490 [Bacteroidales bacterium]|nr:hypothetical protein [Bacteroidales bacterium]
MRHLIPIHTHLRAVLIIATLFLGAFSAMAQSTGYRSIVLTHTVDNEVTQVNLSEDLEVKIDGSFLVIENDNYQINLPISLIANWSYSTSSVEETEEEENTKPEDIRVGVESVGEDNQPPFEMGANVIKFRGLPTNTPIMVTDMAGKQLFNYQASGYWEMSLDGLRSGQIYLLMVGNRGYKISVKR